MNNALGTFAVLANFCIASVATLSTVAADAANPILAVLTSGGLPAVLSVFCWHFMRSLKEERQKHEQAVRELNEKHEQEVRELQNKLDKANAKCGSCDFVQQANTIYLNQHETNK